MIAPTTASAFLDLVRKSGLLSEADLARLIDDELPSEPFPCAEFLIRKNLLTAFQAKQLMAGRFRGLVHGPYRLLRPLGKGGMGIVYLAEHVGLGRKVALKVLTSAKGNEKLSLERFYREARAVAALDHPHIVRLHDITQLGDHHFLVMEYVDGLDLHSLVEQTGALHYAQAVSYVAQAAAGLQHAHARGFVHRDIKPANLMLTKDGTIKILDMGLARSLDDPKDDLTNQFEEGAVAGTADYISPEQALNLALDARSDIYSLGATLFALVSGQPPYSGTTTQKLAQHQLAEAPDLCKRRPTVPAGLGAVVVRMMAKKPRDRYQTAGEVLEALGPWVAPGTGSGGALPGASVATPPPKGRVESPEKKTRKSAAPKEPTAGTDRKWWIVAGAAVLLVATVGAVFAFKGSKKPAETVQPPPAPAIEAPAPNPIVAPAGTPNPVSKVPDAPPEVVAYRLDLSATKPFLHSNTGRTVGNQVSFEGAPEGWGTHSWLAECTHEFFAEKVGGQTALGIRFTTGSPAGMLFVGGIDVAPNRAYVLRVTYRTGGEYTVADVRVREQQGGRLRIAGQGRLTQTNGEWATITIPYKNGNTDKIQIEFHHNGPDGAGNALFVRSLEVVEADPAPPR